MRIFGVIPFIKLQNERRLSNNWMVKNDEKWNGGLTHLFFFFYYCFRLSYVQCLEGWNAYKEC